MEGRDLQMCTSRNGGTFIAGFAALGHMASARQWYLGLALGLYLALIGVVLASSHFVPYGSDNNESFSAFVHARNLLRFGFGEAMGLSDEAYSHDPAAHPYVYTHEGNFPRLPVYLLMRLGLTRIEWQIALLALLIGSVTIYLCFTFFARIAGELFAFLVCAVLTTDYLSFLQWEVNSFRVWHGFFFFASLLCVQSLGSRHSRQVGALFFVTCVALFYFEIVFAIFTVATSLCYGLLIYWRHRSPVYRAALIAGAGVVVAVGGLVAQSAAYLGWTTAWRDLHLTFLNRNFYVQTGGEAAALRTLQFFLQHHIVYWRDNPDTHGYLSIKPFLRAFGQFGLGVETPYLVLLMWTVTVAWLVRRIPLNRFALAALFFGLGLCVAAGYKLSHVLLSGTDLGSLWLGAIEGYFRKKVLLPILTGAFLLGLVVALESGRQFLRLRDDRGLTEGFRYLVAAVAGYVFLYVVSPGYLLQGYLVRYVPLAVFIVDVWIALFFYMLIAIAQMSHREVRDRVRGMVRVPARSAGRLRAVVVPHLVRVLSLFLIVFTAVYWARIQTVYVSAIPPSDYLFMRQLTQEPYRGATFVSDSYAAPIAYYTGTWAYADDLVYQNLYVEKEGKITQMISGDKLWEADRDTNISYLHPQYYVCIRTPTLYIAASFVSLRPGERLSQCSDEILVRNAREGVGPLHNEVVAADPGPWDMWTIVKLDPSIQLAFAGPVFQVNKQEQETDVLQARRLARAVKEYYMVHGCYPSVSARSFGAMPKGLGPYVGGAWPRMQMYGAFDHGWHWVGSGAAASFVGVIPYSVWKANPRGFVSMVNNRPAKTC